ncbi:putative fluoride ion transporter CrcB [Mobilicoccus caccae]|uniref:Fluoride-specific ion channel FluC n=2 Tax=Mobilicoccus caccae TaxID=1859295 RepID=A0ABQ6IUK3_9MICO|nr:putative fluoride ion transporter CrcB [Mobilicoccus caccae]
MVLAVASGGAIGATCRYLVMLARPESGPATTLAVNVLGCFLMGVLVACTPPGSARLRRGFLGTGVLGGFTTVSAYAVTTHGLLTGDVLLGVLYLLATPALAVVAVASGVLLTRRWRTS